MAPLRACLAEEQARQKAEKDVAALEMQRASAPPILEQFEDLFGDFSGEYRWRNCRIFCEHMPRCLHAREECVVGGAGRVAGRCGLVRGRVEEHGATGQIGDIIMMVKYI